MHRNISPPRVIRLLRVSNRESGGFTIIVQRNFSLAQSFRLLTHIRWINLCPHQPNGCLQIGKRSFTNRRQLFDSAATPLTGSREQLSIFKFSDVDRVRRVAV